ncbi:T9SS type A sorting domain-containing protein [Psychroserpens damuponensis]|uniref:T9SS type A sorting domain-containing protein n=1 Tax=Psychroserpens damuponensis TaxID=943936 RepID=UPI000693A6B9|nr:spondin domain-containing protein [Psychroserpens damuponensis]
MKKTTLTLKPVLFVLLLLFITMSYAQSAASYNITFNSIWENDIVDPLLGNSTAAIPGNAHWSNLVGATHNSNYTLVEMGTLASLGVKNVAETGNNDALMTEIMNEINVTGNANQWLQEDFSPFAAISSATLNEVIVDENYPLLSLVSMIAPSPDWMIAVNSLNLRDGNAWKPEVIIELFPYDAGTDSGSTYTAANQISTPFQPISVLINEEPFNAKPIGTLTITLVAETLSTTDTKSITEVSLFPNPSKGVFNISTSNSNTLKEVLVYDVLGKQVAHIKNLNSDNTLKVDLTSLNKGVYLVRLVLNDGSQSTKKVIIS